MISLPSPAAFFSNESNAGCPNHDGAERPENRERGGPHGSPDRFSRACCLRTSTRGDFLAKPLVALLPLVFLEPLGLIGGELVGGHRVGLPADPTQLRPAMLAELGLSRERSVAHGALWPFGSAIAGHFSEANEQHADDADHAGNDQVILTLAHQADVVDAAAPSRFDGRIHRGRAHPPTQPQAIRNNPKARIVGGPLPFPGSGAKSVPHCGTDRPKSGAVNRVGEMVLTSAGRTASRFVYTGSKWPVASSFFADDREGLDESRSRSAFVRGGAAVPF